MKKMDRTLSTPKASLWLLVLLCTVLGIGTRLSAQCNPDVTLPTAACDETTVVSLDVNGQVVVMAATFDDGSYDECCAVSFEARLVLDGPCDGDNLPDAFGPSVTFCCADVFSLLTVEVKVSDCNGNSNTCLTQVEVEDKLKPTCIAPANITVTCENFDPSLMAYGMATGTDNCCFQSVSEAVNNTNFDEICNKGTLVRNFTNRDCHDNLAICSQSITVNYVQEYYVRFPHDIISANGQIPANAGEPTLYAEDCELVAYSYTDEVTNTYLDSLLLIERTWTVINWCTYDPQQGFITVPNPNPMINPFGPANFVGVVVSPEGTPAPWSPTIANLYPNAPSPTNFSQYYAANSNAYRYVQHIYVETNGFLAVEGQVFADNNANCTFDGGEPTLANWKLKCVSTTTGTTSTTYADANGYYKFYVPDNETTATITLESPLNVSGNCPQAYPVNVAQGTTATQNIGVTLNANCAELTADVSAAFVRRCFNNTYYVQVYNSGITTVVGASVEVQLDAFMTLLWSSMPNFILGNNLFKYELGDMAPGQVANINITYNLSCTAPLGYTHCVTAHAYPDEICGNAGQAWLGPVAQVKGRCDGNKVRFEIENVGNQNMATPLEFIVVEDVLMLKNLPNATFELNVNDVKPIEFDANGATWRIIAQQSPDYPYGGTATAVVEGCGGLNQTGLVNLFSNEPSTPYISTDCRENIGSFDPNDKQAFPVGFGAEHFIEQNTELEYLIRFQNTGTDTAFTVVVRDPLSALLDPATVRPGVSSHPYSFSLENGTDLVFRFENILLPDSNINEAASHGFLEFKVRQKADNALGSIIQNKAAIYFDFNDPVITNIVNHTIGKDFIPTVGTHEPILAAAVTPNPATDQVMFALPNGISSGHLQITDALGKVVRTANIAQSTYRMERAGLATGNYWYHITAGNGHVFVGKLVLK